MSISSRIISSLLFVLALSVAPGSQIPRVQAQSQERALSILDAAEAEFESSKMNRVGLEIEFSGVSVEDAVELIRKQTGGAVSLDVTPFDYIDPLTGQKHVLNEETYRIQTQSMGRLSVKREDNGTSLADLQNRASTTAVVEVVSDPLSTYKEVESFQRIVDGLVALGAIGTKADLAVSFQVNVEIGKGEKASMTTAEPLMIMRNYLRPENRKLIAEQLDVPEIRKKYVGLFSEGFMKRLLDPEYKPTWAQLFEDSMYRQSLELMGENRAWDLSGEEVRAKVKDQVAQKGIEALLPAVKWNFVRMSSLMLFHFPKDWMSQLLIDSDWVKPAPILEFREPNNDFRAAKKVRQILGLVQASGRSGTVIFESQSRRLIRAALPTLPKSCSAVFLPTAI